MGIQISQDSMWANDEFLNDLAVDWYFLSWFKGRLMICQYYLKKRFMGQEL